MGIPAYRAADRIDLRDRNTASRSQVALALVARGIGKASARWLTLARSSR